MSNGTPIVRATPNPAWEVRRVPLAPSSGLAQAVEGIAVDARRIYITSYLYNAQQPGSGQAGKLTVLDADTLAKLGDISLSGTPRGVAVNPLRNRIYVAGTGVANNGFKLFNATTFAETAAFQFLGQPTRVAAAIGKDRVYVTNPALGVLHVREATSGALVSNLHVGLGATGVAVDGNRVYVTLANASPGQQQSALVVVNADNNTVLQTVPIAPAQSLPQDAVALPQIKRIFVANGGSGSGAPSPRLTVLSSEHLSPVAEIALPAAATHLAADIQRNRIFAATEVGVLVIDGAQNRIVTTIAPGRPALGVAVSVRGQIAWGDPASGVLSTAAQPGASQFDLTLLRPDDLLYLDYEFVNLTLVTEGAAPRLVRQVAGQPAFVIVHVAPQSIAEQTSSTSAQVRAPVPAVLAGRSRLAFRVPDNVTAIPYTAAGLLDWRSLEPSLHPAALASSAAVPNPRPSNTQPLPTHTAIELPYRLVLSPDTTATWEHSAQPVTHGDRAELWHTRLRRRDGSAADPDVRAVWTPDFQLAPPHAHAFPLSPEQRKKIARLSADWTLLNGQPAYRPEPVEADELMLTALGGFLRARGAWNAPDSTGLNLALWRQSTTLGRDHEVMAVLRGKLFPWGHRAVKVEVVERAITSTPDGPIAALRKREFIVVTQAERSYANEPYIHSGREMPFTASVRVLTTTTPDLKLNPSDMVVSANGEVAFWVRTADGLFNFDISAADPTDGRTTWAAPLIWIPEPLANNTVHINTIADAYTAATSRRSVDVVGQQIALVAPSNGAAASNGRTLGGQDIRLAADQLTFSIQKRTLSSGGLSILPRLESARVHIPAVEQMLGVADALDVELYEEYLKHGLQSAHNAAAVYAKLATAQLPKLDLPVEKAGGLAAASMAVQGISERLGPVVGDLGELAQGKFGALSLKALEKAKLLGTISLMELIDAATGIGDFEKQLPALGTEIERNGAGVPTAVTNRLRWTPNVRNVGPFIARLNDDNATLAIETFFRQEIGGSPPDYRISGVLSNFHIDFGGVLAVNFRKLSFESLAGKKPDIEPVLDEARPITFRGPLEFLDKLREKIPFDGFSDPPALDISSRGIDVSYSLGLPPLSFGAFNLQNVTLGAGLFLPFTDEAARMRFNFAERHNPFQLTVLAIGGGGFFALDVALNRIVAIEAALEFGGSVAVNLGIASGGVYIMGGVYFALKSGATEGDVSTELTGYVRAGGYLSVLGLITVSTEFYMELRYDFEPNELHGQATVRYKVRIAFWSKTVKITLKRRFAGPPRSSQAALLARRGQLVAAVDDHPSFGDGMTEADWQAYAASFA